jgi:hypothetical protein
VRFDLNVFLFFLSEYKFNIKSGANINVELIKPGAPEPIFIVTVLTQNILIIPRNVVFEGRTYRGNQLNTLNFSDDVTIKIFGRRQI